MEIIRKLVNHLAKKKPEPIEPLSFPPRFRIIAADLSLKRPGFCKMLIHQTEQGIEIERIDVTNINNKTSTKPHGELLDDVLRAMAFFFPTEHDPYETFFVREKAALGTMPLAMIGQAKMAGMMDWVVWRLKHAWHEIAPMSIKKLVTGFGKADKDQVRDALKDYIGEHEYACDDESDAAAVGVAWLIEQGLLKSLHEPEPKKPKPRKSKDKDGTEHA